MNKLDTKTRAQILHMLVEGNSMRSVSRLSGVSFNTIVKLLVDAGQVCAAYHSRTVQNVKSQRVQCDSTGRPHSRMAFSVSLCVGRISPAPLPATT